MHILVTGASGFTGQHFIRHARALGLAVHALESNLSDSLGLLREISEVQPTHVLHLAGISFVGHQNDPAFYEVNLFGTLRLLEAIDQLERPVQRVVLASTANVFGVGSGDPISEIATPAPINHYGMSKLAMEHMARARFRDMNLVFVRPFNYTGPGQSANFLIPKLVSHFKRRAPFIELGNLDVAREFNDIRMVVEVYLQFLTARLDFDTYHLCSGRPYALQEVIDALESLTNYRIDVRTQPSLSRGQEIPLLCGHPERLQAAITQIPEFSLKETLRSMLEAES